LKQHQTAARGRVGTKARTGLRMMPTFPSSPLKFRTAGFPQYGFKAGFQRWPSPSDTDVPYPSSLPTAFVRVSLCMSLRTVSVMQESRLALPCKRSFRSTPGVLAPVQVLLSWSIFTYSTPSAPLTGTSRFRCLATYTRCPRCASLPRRPISGSVLSLLILYRHVVLFDSGKLKGCLHPVPSPSTLAFVPFRQTRHFQASRKSVSRGAFNFEASLQFAFATTCRLARPPDGSDQTLPPANGNFYFRASNGSVTLTVAGYNYGDNWVSFTDGTFTR
jgi:hypothetical protein